MNDTERAELMDELTQAQHDAWPGVDADFIVNTEAIMPILARLLAAQSLDGLLGGVPHDGMELNYRRDIDHPNEGFQVGMQVLCMDGRFKTISGTGATRDEALRNAVQKAKEFYYDETP